MAELKSDEDRRCREEVQSPIADCFAKNACTTDRADNKRTNGAFGFAKLTNRNENSNLKIRITKNRGEENTREDHQKVKNN